MRSPLDLRKALLSWLAFGAVIALVPLSVWLLMSSPAETGLGWWLALAILVADLALVSVAVYRLLNATWQDQHMFGRNREQAMSDAKIVNAPFVRIATLTYEIADPQHPEEFSAYLDKPIYPDKPGWEQPEYQDSSSQTRALGETSALQVSEKIRSLIQDYGRRYGDQVRIELEIARNSLDISLLFLVQAGITAFNLAAQYHDLVESITLFDSQMQRLLSGVARDYRGATGHTALIRQNATITPTHLAQMNSPATLFPGNAMGAMSNPTYITSPTAPGNSINITIGSPSATNRGLGCAIFLLTVILTSAALIFILGSVYCRFFDSAGLCADVLFRLVW